MKQEKSRRIVRGIIAIAAAVVLLAADQIIKRFVLLRLKPVGTVSVISGLLEFSYVENTGAAFGLFKNSIWLITAVSIAAFAVILVLLFRYKAHTFFSYGAAVLLLAGGIGNLVDRLCYGFVVDFIHVLFFDYIFNFADCCVTVGAVLFVVHALLISHREKQQQKAEPTDGEGAEK